MAYVESFNGRLRDELLERELFCAPKEAQVLVGNWHWHYNHGRPHSSLGYRPLSHARCCTCPPIPNATGVCMEVPVGPVQGGHNTLVCACVYTNAQGQVVAVGLDYNPVTGEPDCDSQAKRLVANSPPPGALQSQSCAGFCNAGDCKPTIEETWTNVDADGPHYYKDEYCECK